MVWVGVASFVRLYEEPTLATRDGEAYTAHRRAVRGLWRRARPWTGDEARLPIAPRDAGDRTSAGTG